MGEQFTVPEEKLLLDKLIHFFRDSAEKLNVNDGLPDQLLLKNVEQFMMWIVMGDEAQGIAIIKEKELVNLLQAIRDAKE